MMWFHLLTSTVLTLSNMAACIGKVFCLKQCRLCPMTQSWMQPQVDSGGNAARDEQI